MRVRGWQRLLDVVSKFLGRIKKIDQGMITLSHGEHIVYIPTDCKPETVHLTFRNRDDENGMQVCQGNLNFVSASLGDRGFNLFAKINTDMVNIVWFAAEETGNDED